jgi:hypothetical protein
MPSRVTASQKTARQKAAPSRQKAAGQNNQIKHALKSYSKPEDSLTKGSSESTESSRAKGSRAKAAGQKAAHDHASMNTRIRTPTSTLGYLLPILPVFVPLKWKKSNAHYWKLAGKSNLFLG